MVLDRQWRQLPSGAYKVQACESWLTLVMVIFASLLTGRDIGVSSILADDLLLQLLLGSEEVFCHYFSLACSMFGMSVKGDICTRGRWDKYVLVGYNVHRNRCTLDVKNLLASLLRRERYQTPGGMSIDEMQALRSCGLSQINQGYDERFQRLCSKFCQRVNKYSWTDEEAAEARVPSFLGRGHVDFALNSLWNERHCLNIVDRGNSCLGPDLLVA